MKKIALIIFPIVFPLVVLSQPCLPEGISFTNQAQIDSFQINYPGCTEIEGDVNISGDDITSLNGLNVLTSIGGYLDIVYNDALTNLMGLEGLTSIGERCKISGNGALSSLTGLEGLTYIGGTHGINGSGLGISANEALTSLTGLEGLTFIGSDLAIIGNDTLTDLTGLDNLTYIERHLIITDNDALTSLTGLEGVSSIEGDVQIYNMDALISMTGLEGLTSIGGELMIGFYNPMGNDALNSLAGLDNVTSIGGGLSIGWNTALTSLSGLDNIDAASIDYLSIWGNPLSTCEVESVCAYLASPNGNISIHDNAPGCNSPEEVLDSCEANAVSIEERYILEDFSLSPNPFTTSTTISYTLEKPSIVTICIFNPQGQLIKKIEKEQYKDEQQVQWNTEGQPAGMYYFRIQAGDKVGGGKMVKLD